MIELITSKLTHKDTDPCFLVDNKKFYSRYHAFKHAYGLIDKAHSNNIWDKVKFETYIDHKGLEPKESAANIWQARARQLRKDYEYVRIWASGGADSTNVIHSFKAAGVCPDEIAVYMQYPGMVQPFTNIEVDYSLRPLLPEIQSWWPNVKIEFYPILPEHYYWYSKNAIEHFVAYTQLVPNAFSWQIPYEVHPKLQKHGQNYKTVDIYGGPDIMVGVDEMGWYYRNVDRNFNDAFNAPYQEYFYADAAVPDLTLKTVYAAKRYIEKKYPKNYFGEWSIKLSAVSELDFILPTLNEFGDKNFKDSFKNNGILVGGNSKSSIRIQNMLGSVLGQTSFMNIVSFLKELGDLHPNWFHNNNVIENWVGILSQKVYWMQS